MTNSLYSADRCEMVNSFPEHIRKQVVEILKTGIVQKELLYRDDIVCYLSVSSMSQPLKDACEDILLESVNTVNSVDALELALKFGLLRLKKEATSLIVENVDDVLKSQSFQSITEISLETMCNIEKVAKHSNIFKALDMWLQFNHETRLTSYCKMLEIVQHHRTPRKPEQSNESFNTYHAMLMLESSKRYVVTAVFNCDGELVCHRKLFKSTNIKDGFSVACVQKDETDAPYVFINSGKYVFRYDPMLNKDESCSNLVNSRTNGGSLVSFGEKLYVIGGQYNGKSVPEIEELSTTPNMTSFLKKPVWKSVATLPDNVYLQSPSCLLYKNKIYIVGESSNDGHISTAVIVFTPEDKSVKIVAEFPKQCSDCKAVLHGSDIYIASSEGCFLKFNIESNIFTSCSDLPTKSKHFGIYVERDMIYTVGGALDDNDVGQFEKDEYDIETNCWKKSRNLPCNLPIYGNVDIKVPSYTSVVPFYDTQCKEIRP